MRDHLRVVPALFCAFACSDQAPGAPAVLPGLEHDAAEESACTQSPPAEGQARAKHVACAAELATGPLAMGRIGDVLLENARVRLILRAARESATTIGAPGGGIVDAAFQGGGRVDQAKEILPTFDKAGVAATELVVVRAGGDEAVVRAPFTTVALGLVESVFPGLSQAVALHGVLEYRLRGDESAVRVRACALPDEGAGTVSAALGMAVLLGGAVEVLAPGEGVLDPDRPSANPPELLAEAPEVAYGLVFDAPRASVLHVNTTNLVTAARKTRFEGGGVAACVEMRFAVAATESDAADALATVPFAQRLEIAVPDGGRVEISDPAGGVVLRSRGAGGRVRAGVGAGAYTAKVANPFGLFGPVEAVPPTGTLVVRAQIAGEPGAPLRITAVGLDGLDVEQRFVVAAGAEARRTLPTGHYRISASRGSEYDLAQMDLVVPAAMEAQFNPVLTRVVDTTGYLATDYHLHTELSTDSSHRLVDAVRQMAAEGLELVAATDHDFVSDLQSVIDASDVKGYVTAIAGEEVSTTRFGHFGGYPLRRDPDRSGFGAVPWFGLSPHQIFQGLRDRGADIVQANHPRLGSSGFFTAIGLDPSTGRTGADPTALGLPAGTDLSDLSFDVIEAWNGYSRGGNEMAFIDFLRLLEGGRRFVMVGNSDSHRPDLPPGAPRTYVRVPDDGRGSYTWAQVLAALRGGDVSVAAGLFVELSTVDGSRPGGLAHASGGQVTAHVRVQAPPWADCTRLRLFRGSSPIVDRPIATPRGQAVRFDEDLVIPIPADTFLVARADGDEEAAPVFPFRPFGVTNPLRVTAGSGP